MLSVLVTRPRPAGEEFAAKLRSEGFAVHLAPLAAYEEVPAEIGPTGHYQALAFTSAEAVRIFAKRSQERAATVFAVGEATAREASRVGFHKIWQAEGSSEDVLRLIRQKKGDLRLKRLLHISGEETAQDLASSLIEDGVAVERKTVYRAEYIDALPSSTVKALLQGEIDAVTLFSPKTAAHFVKMMQERHLRGTIPTLKAVCLSARVAQELNGLNFLSVTTAPRPSAEGMIEALNNVARVESADSGLAANPVIAAFGGLRPLAKRLGLTPSTVQGWKKRGIIPEPRVEAVLAAAREDGISIEGFRDRSFRKDSMDQKPDGKKDHSLQAAFERRAGADRRQKQQAFQGAERRSGVDRRLFLAQQRKLIAEEKTSFAIKVVAGCVLTVACLLASAFFIFAPEIKALQQKAERAAQVEEERLQETRKINAKQDSLSALIAGQLEKIEAAKNIPAPEPQIIEKIVESDRLRGYLTALARANGLRQAPGGQEALASSLGKLAQVMPAQTSPQGVAAAIDLVRREDTVLASILEGVESPDTAALLLAVGDLNARLKAERPFEESLSLLQKLGLGNADAQAALSKLAPYAQSGIASLGTLQTGFKEIAMDVVMAKLQGEDLSAQEQILKRMSKFVKMRRVDDIDGSSPDAIVARADLLLGKSDLAGAIAEIARLEGAPKTAAASWLHQAEGNATSQGIASAIVTAFATGISAGTGVPVSQVGGLFSGVFGDLGVASTYAGTLPSYQAR